MTGCIGHRGHASGSVRANCSETIAFWKNEPADAVSASESSSTMPFRRRVESTWSRTQASETDAPGSSPSA